MVQQGLDLQKSWSPGKLHGTFHPPWEHTLHTQETALPFPEWPAQVQMIITGCTAAAANDSLYYSSPQEPQSQARTLLCQVLHKYKLMTCGNAYIQKNRDRGIKKSSFTFSNAARRTWAWPVTSTTTAKRERAELVKPLRQHKHKSPQSWILVHLEFLSCYLFYFHLLLKRQNFSYLVIRLVQNRARTKPCWALWWALHNHAFIVLGAPNYPTLLAEVGKGQENKALSGILLSPEIPGFNYLNLSQTYLV